MPRYIDADKLTRMFIGNLTFVPQEFIDSAKTVDAIPIKWIEQYIENEIKRYGCKIPETNAIKDMIDDWRKENESNISN